MKRKVSLVGNPNSGKSSIFNLLTGLYQKTGNYPGVTVERKVGSCKLPNNEIARISDLPGTYSLTSATSADEKVVLDSLLDESHEDFPDMIVFVADTENLKRNLLLFTQILELHIPTVLVINMSDNMKSLGISINISKLESLLDTKIVLTSAKKNQGIDEIKQLISDYDKISNPKVILSQNKDSVIHSHSSQINTYPYKSWLSICSNINNETLEGQKQIKLKQHKESVVRYQFIKKILTETYKIDPLKRGDIRGKIDRILMHKFWGYVIFIVILGLIFQTIYNIGVIDAIDNGFSWLAIWIKSTFPPGILTNLIADGILSGIGGIIVFIPQIALLFLFISILEESGYMSRVIYLMDKIMSRFGLSGKSIIPLISGIACAIPAIMATRNIENTKERLITSLVLPFMTCSARLPVYLIIISIVIPKKFFFGLNLQGIVLLGLYLFGVIVALLAASILNKVIKRRSKNIFITEMPNYRIPLTKNVFLTAYNKSKSFVFGAGKIILTLSIILWFLASHGTKYSESQIKEIITTASPEKVFSEKEMNKAIESYQLENSYIGQASQWMEPVIRPLGYDWKIGVALITSFAARELFVSTLSTIFSINNNEPLKEKLAKEIDSKTGKKLFNLASGISLLLFYALAMQCMSTLAVMRRETNSWKWPFYQLIFMNSIAYISALLVYKLLSPLI